MKSPTYYDVLGISSHSTAEEVTKAYRRAMRIAHPDTSGEAHSPLAALVTQAYDVLRDPTKRAEYDQSLESHSPASSAESWGEEANWDEPVTVDPDDTDADSSAPFFGYPEHEQDSAFAPPAVIDVNTLSWWDKAKELKDATYLPGKKNLGLVILFSVLGLALYLGVPHWGSVESNMRAIFAGFQSLGLLLVLPFAFGRKGKSGWVGFTVTGLLLAAFFGFIAGSWSLSAYFAATTAFMSGTAVGWRKWRVSRGAGTQDAISLQDAQTNFVFGDPGHGLYEAMTFFGAENVAKGVHGERMTATVLENLLVLPGVRIIHGLQFPGSKKADVDHAVICGNRVAFIDSKYWSGGHWRWEGPGFVSAGGYPREMHFQNAVESFRRSLKGMQVQGWVLIHSNNGVPVTTDNSHAAGQPHLVDAQQAMEEIGTWLLEGQPATVDRYKLTELLSIRK